MVGGSAEGVKSTLPSVRPEERTTLVEPEPESGLCQEDLLLLAAVYSAPANSLARDTIRRTWGGQLRSRLGVNDILDIILTQVMSRTDDRVRMSDDPRNRNVDNTQENRCKSRLSHFIKPFFIRTLHFNDRNRSVTYKNKLGYTLKKLNGHFLFLFLYISL